MTWPLLFQSFLKYIFVGRQIHCTILGPNFYIFKEPKNQFQGTYSARQCSLAGRYGNPIPTPSPPIDCLKIPTLLTLNYSPQCTHLSTAVHHVARPQGPQISRSLCPPSPLLQGNIWEIFPNAERWEECGDNARDKLTHTHKHTHTRTVHPRTLSPPPPP